MAKKKTTIFHRRNHLEAVISAKTSGLRNQNNCTASAKVQKRGVA